MTLSRISYPPSLQSLCQDVHMYWNYSINRAYFIWYSLYWQNVNCKDEDKKISEKLNNSYSEILMTRWLPDLNRRSGSCSPTPYHLAKSPNTYYLWNSLRKQLEFQLYDSDGNWTRVTAVKGRCLNLLTTEPKITDSILMGFRHRTFHRQVKRKLRLQNLRETALAVSD